MHFLYSKNRFRHAIAVCLPLALAILTSHNSFSQVISCHEEVNVSLDNNCMSLIEPQDILTDVVDGVDYTVELRDENNAIIAGNTLTIDHLWTQVMAKVTQANSNSCWGILNVEDKLGPTINCIDTITLDCFDSLDTFPDYTDNCMASSISIFSETTVPLFCNVDYIKQLDRLYVAEDEQGNTSSCAQTILLNRIDLSLIVFPDTFSVANGNALSCSAVTYDADGFPDFASAGVPTLNGEPIFPNVDVYCNIGVSFEDILVVDQLCLKKYMRTWTVFESWCSDGPFVRYFQVIEVTDNESPVITQPLNVNVAAGSGPNCNATVILPVPAVTDDCPGAVSIDISYDGGFIPNVTAPQTVTFDAGVNRVTYRAYDACGNSDTTSITVTVLDQSAPTAICDENTVVSLRSDGTAKAWADTFDDGSFDNCGALFKTVVQRLDNSCNCDTVQFKDMEFLGQRNGRYYYLSDEEVFGFQAIAFSESFGGIPLTLESAEEATWVHDRISAITSDSYYIGLTLKEGTGDYVYTDHTTPAYTNWDSGQPVVGGNQAVVSSDGTWFSADGSIEEYRYVYEATTPCGYSDEVHFCCSDAGSTVMVSFRAIDKFGGFNDCMVEVEVQDKVAPVIQCPTDRTLDCSTNIDFSNLEIYGTATATDACTQNVTETILNETNSCGVGQVTRTFSAADANGSSTCVQTISLLSSSVSTSSAIVWPEDYSTDDGCIASNISPENLPDGFGFPDLTNASCTNLSATFSDKTFAFPGQGSTACFKVVRTWTVIDDCMHDMPGYTPEVYEQSIKVSDAEAPIPNSCEDITVTTTDCTGASVLIVGSATDNCTDVEDINSRITIDFFSDGVIEDDENYNSIISYSNNFPLGSHIATSQYFDGCGNTGTCTQRITVTNNQVPLAVCVSGLSIPLQEMDLDNNNTIDTIMAVIQAEMLDGANASAGTSGSSHPCNYTIGFSLDAAGTVSSMNFDCDDIGDNSVTLYVTDTAGGRSSCVTTVTVTDVNALCDNSGMRPATIAGQIITEMSEAVEEVQVELLGSDMPYEMTQNDGSYAFSQMSAGGDYVLSPTKNDDPLNGVSTLDIIQIQRHILGSELLDSPYKLIAADIDNSESITALDMIELRKLILGVTDEFSDVNSWRIIDSNQSFSDPLNPFLSELNEDVSLQNLNSSRIVNFIGVKVGDVNNTVIANAQDSNLDQRSSESVVVDISDSKNVQSGEYAVEFVIKDLSDVDGLQMSLSYNSNSMDIISLDSEIASFTKSNYFVDRTNGIINISWDSQSADVSSDILFELRYHTTSSSHSVFDLNRTQLSAELYRDNNIYNLELRKEETVEHSTKPILYQNIPNPWSESTEIKFYLERDQDIELNFYNPAGQLLYREIKVGTAGENSSIIDNETFSEGGIIYYELVTQSTRIIDKMLLVK